MTSITPAEPSRAPFSNSTRSFPRRRHVATVSIPDENRVVSGFEQVKQCLAGVGIQYERWRADKEIDAGAPADQILDAYSSEIDRLKKDGGYVTADVIDVRHDTPGLEAMLAKFNREHWHDEDEVRFIIEGSGLFHVRPPDGPVLAIEVEEGDLIRVPRGTRRAGLLIIQAARRMPGTSLCAWDLPISLFLNKRGIVVDKCSESRFLTF